MQSSWVRGSINGRAQSEGAMTKWRLHESVMQRQVTTTLQRALLRVHTLGVLIHSLCITFFPPLLWLQPKFTSFLAVYLSSFSFNLIHSNYLGKFCFSPHRIRELEQRPTNSRAQKFTFLSLSLIKETRSAEHFWKRKKNTLHISLRLYFSAARVLATAW